MISFDQYRLHERAPDFKLKSEEGNEPQSYNVKTLEDLEKYLINNIESQLELLKIKLMDQVKSQTMQQPGLVSKIRNWWGNWLNGTKGESVENLSIQFSPFVDDALLRELKEIMEGPIDQAIVQIQGLIDQLKVNLTKTIRDGFRRVYLTASMAPRGSMPSAAAPRPAGPDLSPFKTNATPSADPGFTSRFQTKLTPFSYPEPKKTEPKKSEEKPKEKEEKPKEPIFKGPEIKKPEEKPEIPPEKLPPEPETEPSEIQPEKEVPLKTGLRSRLARKAIGITGDPESGEKPEDQPVEKPTEPEKPEVAPEPESEKPALRVRKPKFVGSQEEKPELSGQEDFTAREKLTTSSVLKQFPKEIGDIYESQPDNNRKRKMIQFLQTIHGSVLDQMREDGYQYLPNVLQTLNDIDPDKWAKIAVNIEYNPKILSNPDKMKKWISWILKEGIDRTTANLIENFRDRCHQ